MKYKVDWKTFDVTIEKDKFIIVIDSNNLPRGISTYKNGDEPATERLFKEGCRWEYWDNIINGSFIPSHQYNCSVEIPSDIIVETDLEKQEKVNINNLKIAPKKVTGILMGQFGKETPFPMFDVFDNNFNLPIVQTEETNKLYKEEFEEHKQSSYRALHVNKGDSSFSLFIKPSEKSIQELREIEEKEIQLCSSDMDCPPGTRCIKGKCV